MGSGRRWHAPWASRRRGCDVTGHPLLQVEDVSKAFRGVRAVEGVSFEVARHTITALIGPNGAGKTTLFSLIAGAQRPERGQSRLNGRAIGGVPAHRVCAAGVGRTFQLVKPFAGMTVLDNAIVGAMRGERTVAGARGREVDGEGNVGGCGKGEYRGSR